MPLERIDGRVVAIRYARDDFVVALFDVKGGGEVAILGELSEISEGDHLSLYGQSSNHPKHGPQFRVEYYHPLLADGRRGITTFLSEQVPGIGPALAERIVAYFYPLWGDELLEQLVAAPERLSEVHGLGEAKQKQLREALLDHVGGRRLLARLYSLGVAPRVARAIQSFYEARGVNPLLIVERTPYQLLHDVPGVGFETVDRLGRELGLPADDDGRIEAAISHLLQQGYQRDGHLFLPEQRLLPALSDLIWGGRPPADYVDRIGDALERMRSAGYVQIVTVGETLAFYPRQGWLTEYGLAEQLQRLRDQAPGPLAGYLDAPRAFLEVAEAQAGLTLDEAQRAAFQQAMSSGITIITGGPGTGKSTLARLIVQAWEEASLRIRLAAPTGRAARRLSETTGREATTIHRLLEWSEGSFQRHEQEPLEAEALLVDESSMLDAPLALALLRAVKGGSRLLLMGDVDQLPSVGPGTVLHDLIASDCFPVARLTVIHRQDTSRENLIVSLAHAVNQAPRGQPIPGGATVARRPDEGNVFLFDARMPWGRCSCGALRLPAACPACRAGTLVAPLPPEARGGELVQQLVTERIPAAFGIASDDVQVIAPRYAGPLGVDEINERLRGALNPARAGQGELRVGARHFRLGDRVMAVRNNYEKDVVNGLQGRVVDVDVGRRSLSVQFDGDVRASFQGEALDDLTHAYAITAHKSQGGEFPVVLLALDPHAGRLLYRQLLYTAITRAKSLLILVGDPTVLDRATANDRPRHRWTGLDWWLAQGS